MSVTPINTHVSDALARLLIEYKNSPRLQSIITALTSEIQDLEDAYHAIDSARSILDASGSNLDLLGSIVGVTRAEETPDNIFRILIYGKIAANISQGETESVIATYGLLTQATEVRLTEFFPAAIQLYSNGVVDPIVAPFVGIYLKQATAAGVSLDSFGVFAANAHFGFFGDPGAVGFGDELDPTVGGGFASQLG